MVASRHFRGVTLALALAGVLGLAGCASADDTAAATATPVVEGSAGAPVEDEDTESLASGPRPGLTMLCSEYNTLPTSDDMLAATSEILTAEFAAGLSSDSLWELANNVSYLCGESTTDAPIAGPVVQTALAGLGATWDDVALSLAVAKGDATVDGVVFPGEVGGWRVVSPEEFDDFWALYWSPPSDQADCLDGIERSLTQSGGTGNSVSAYYTDSADHIAVVGCPFATATASRSDTWGTMLDAAPLVEGVPCLAGDGVTRDVCGTKAHDAVWFTVSFGGGDDTQAIAELLNGVVDAQ